MAEPELDLVTRFVLPLQAAGIDYMISGSVASIFYGVPRATLDIDIALRLATDDLPKLIAQFPAPEYYCPPLEVLGVEIARPTRGHFNIIHVNSGMKADLYPSRSHRYFAWAMENRRSIGLGDCDVHLAPPEYVILWKLEFFREGGGDKHLRDIEGMLDVRGDVIDRSLLDAAVAELGLSEQWKEIG